jgi:Ser/Thr protein kinase RdoA (MazF antagonist)
MDSILEQISAPYGLKLSIVKEVRGGFLSENFEVTDGNSKYFLKRHRHQSRDAVENVCAAEKFFSEGGVPVVLPLSTLAGKVFVELDGRFYSLYPFVEGHQFERGALSDAAAESLGVTLAHLHQRGKESRLPVTGRLALWDTADFLRKIDAIEQKIGQEAPNEFNELTRKSLQLKRTEVERNTVTPERLRLPYDHLLHGDYFCDNVFFDKQGHISHVFDFEKVEYGPPAYELFRAVFVSFFSIPSEDNLRHAKRYVDAYVARYPLPGDLLQDGLTAAYLRQAHSLWVEGEHYLKGSSRPDPILPSQYALNEYYFTNRERIHEFLLDGISI